MLYVSGSTSVGGERCNSIKWMMIVRKRYDILQILGYLIIECTYITFQ
jgi:hypothetical protein